METAAFEVSGPIEWNRLPSTFHGRSISLDFQEEAENSSITVQKIMGSKNTCALEFASILGHIIKCSVGCCFEGDRGF